jgi:DNA-binding NtrC family response regulator
MKTILLVDDEPDLLGLLEEILERAGYAVIAKPDAESALSVLLNRISIDLVITDLCLPGMSGSELVEVLRKGLPSVPVIMLTAFGSVESYVESRCMGVFEYINKPVQARELRRIVKTALHESSAVSARHAACQPGTEMLPSS